jgi:hypothetical protein
MDNALRRVPGLCGSGRGAEPYVTMRRSAGGLAVQLYEEHLQVVACPGQIHK